MFFGLKNLFWGSLHSKPLHGSELIILTTITGTKFCHGMATLVDMATIFSVCWTNKYFMGSLLSIHLYRLELISFSLFCVSGTYK